MQATTVKKVWILLVVIIIAMAWFRSAGGQIPQENPGSAQGPRALVVDVEGPIGPATRDFILRSLENAVATNASLVIIRLDTPGGLDASTRAIVKAILSSPVPFATFVAPEGARAASAGTYILLAAHIAAMSPTTPPPSATTVVSRFAPDSTSRSRIDCIVATVLYASPSGSARLATLRPARFACSLSR